MEKKIRKLISKYEQNISDVQDLLKEADLLDIEQIKLLRNRIQHYKAFVADLEEILNSK